MIRTTHSIIFLDFDGVLCIDGFFFEPYTVNNLIEIIDATDADIIISSAWRLHQDYLNLIKQSNQSGCGSTQSNSWIDRIIDITPDFGYKDDPNLMPFTEFLKLPSPESIRESEIKHSLSKYPDLNWVAIDDMNLNLPNFVHTKLRHGLTSSHKDQAIEILLKNPH